MLRFDRKQQNSVKQLSFNKKKIKKTKVGLQENINFKRDQININLNNSLSCKSNLEQYEKEKEKLKAKLNFIYEIIMLWYMI